MTIRITVLVPSLVPMRSIAEVAYGSSNPALEKQLQGSAIERLVRFVRAGGSRSHVTPPCDARVQRRWVQSQ